LKVDAARSSADDDGGLTALQKEGAARTGVLPIANAGYMAKGVHIATLPIQAAYSEHLGVSSCGKIIAN